MPIDFEKEKIQGTVQNEFSAWDKIKTHPRQLVSSWRLSGSFVPALVRST